MSDRVETEGSPDEIVVRLQAARGDRRLLGDLLEGYRPRLRHLVKFRLDRRLQGRVDASDVIQEAFMDAIVKLEAYLDHPSVPFFLWLRLIAAEKVIQIHRHHLGYQKRDARRDVSIHQSAFPAVTSAVLAVHLVDRQTSPSGAAQRNERTRLIAEALEKMEPLDREVLSLRHFELLSNVEAAQVLCDRCRQLPELQVRGGG